MAPEELLPKSRSQTLTMRRGHRARVEGEDLRAKAFQLSVLFVFMSLMTLIATSPARKARAAGAGGFDRGYRVQVGAFRDEENLMASRHRLWTAHEDMFHGVPACMQDYRGSPDKGRFFRLQVGSFGTMSEATTYCDELKARNVECFVVQSALHAPCTALPDAIREAPPGHAAALTELPVSVARASQLDRAIGPVFANDSTPAVVQASNVTQAANASPAFGTPASVRKEAELDFDFDDPPETRYRLTDYLSIGAKVKLAFDWENDLNLDSGDDNDLATAEPELKVALSFTPSDRIQAFMELELAQKYLIDSPADARESTTSLELKQAYVGFPELYPGFTLQLGRQRFNDEREWWYDEKLDAARLFFRRGRFGVEASASRKEIYGDDLLNSDEGENINNYFLVGRYAYQHDAELDAYVFVRDDRSDDQEDTVFLGVRGIGEMTRSIDYWLDAALVRGTEGGKNIRAYGFDVGSILKFASPLKPSLTLAVAFGSGDSNPDDNVDRNFRQTGFQDNKGRFNGVTNIQYYGEVLQPELSNLWILTGGIGIRPIRKGSIDLVYHYYRQDQGSDNLRDAEIDVDPDGRNRDLGQGLDLIFGYKGFRDVSMEIVFGSFFPGNAFPSDADNAYFSELKLSYKF